MLDAYVVLCQEGGLFGSKTVERKIYINAYANRPIVKPPSGFTLDRF